jgi:hypothetical protein
MDIGRVGLLDVLGVDGGVGWDFSNTRSQATAVRINVWNQFMDPFLNPGSRLLLAAMYVRLHPVFQLSQKQ